MSAGAVEGREGSEARSRDWPWRDESPETAYTWIARAPLLPLAWLVGAGARLHRLATEREIGPFRRSRLACPVVSVGALAAGGTAKTPTAAALARLLQTGADGGPPLRVAIASRGYGRRGRGVLCVSDGRTVAGTAETAGDEPLWLARQVPGVPVFVGRDRAEAGQAALDRFVLDAIVLDDGFQHHRLARDVDLVCVDARAGLGSACVPRGPRRERLSGLSRADALLVIDPPLAIRDLERLERHAPSLPVYEADRRPRGLRRLFGAERRGWIGRWWNAGRDDEREALAGLAGREVGLFSGIARPQSLRHSVETLGASIVAERSFPDHRVYREGDFSGGWLDRAPLWITTAKDAPKLRSGWFRGRNVAVLDEEIVFREPDAIGALVRRRLERFDSPDGA